MPRTDIPHPESVRDYALLKPHVRRAARETWFDPDWLWNLCKGMQDAGLPTERTLQALQRQHQMHRLPFWARLYRLYHLKIVKGFWDY
jgi:hypothetical protein